MGVRAEERCTKPAQQGKRKPSCSLVLHVLSALPDQEGHAAVARGFQHHLAINYTRLGQGVVRPGTAFLFPFFLFLFLPFLRPSPLDEPRQWDRHGPPSSLGKGPLSHRFFRRPLCPSRGRRASCLSSTLACSVPPARWGADRRHKGTGEESAYWYGGCTSHDTPTALTVLCFQVLAAGNSSKAQTNRLREI